MLGRGLIRLILPCRWWQMSQDLVLVEDNTVVFF